MQTRNKTLASIKGFIIMAAALMLISCGDPEINDAQMVNAARDYLAQNKIREAAIELKNALQGNPDNAEARYLMGIINLDVGDTASAIKEFRRAAEAGWSEEQARSGLARAMIESNAFQRVLDEVEVEDSYSISARADLYALRALAHAGLGDSKQAKSVLAKASVIDPDAFHVLRTALQIQFSEGDKQGAAEDLKHALEVYPDSKEFLLLSAILAQRNNDLTGAAEAYRKVIAQDPDKLATNYGRKARLALARIQVMEKNFDQAQTILAPLFNQTPDDPETNFVGGVLSFEQGELDLAEERLLKVLKVAPDHAQTQLLFGTVSYAQKDYEQAAYYIARYVRTVPDNLEARKLLGRTYMALGQHEEAKATLQPGLEAGGDDAELLALVGLSQLQGGNIASGIKGLEGALLAAPDSSNLKSELAKAYLSAGQTENAIKQLNAIIAEGGNKKQTEVLLITAHIRAGHFNQAIDIALEQVQQNPEDPAVLSLAGNVFAASNDRPEARKYFNRALQLEPGYVPAIMLLGSLEETDGNLDKAEVLYKKLADSNKEDIASLMALARLAETRNQKEKMPGWLEEASRRAPKDIKTRKILAEYYLHENLLEKAGAQVKEAIRIAPRDNSLLVMQARLQMAEGQYNKSLSTLNELVTRAPDSLFARAMLGETYFRLDQNSDARRQLGIVLEKQPYYTPALVLMASLELRAGSYEKALEYAAQVQKTQPDLYMGYELAGDASMSRKDVPAAKASYEQAWQRKQTSELAIKLSEALVRTGKTEEATIPLRAWLDTRPDDARVLQFLGSAYQNTKQNDKAMEMFERVLAVQPDNIVALNNLAWLYSLSSNPKALELAEKAHRVSPDDSGIQDTYGWVLVQQGQVDKGQRMLEQVMKVMPGVPEIEYHYAVALIKSGEGSKGRKILRRLLESGKPFEGRDDAEQLIK